MALVGLHSVSPIGPYLVIYLILLTSVADTSAYFGGKRGGARKLAPQLSPGKTWEGAITAFAVTGLFSAISSVFLNVATLGLLEATKFVALSAIVVAMSIVGDLTESLFKRLAKLKDSGSILPEHGGVLDRIDSMTAAAPYFVFGLWFALDVKVNLNAAMLVGVTQH